MRLMGTFHYCLLLTSGDMIAQVTAPLEIKEGDEICYRGNKFFVKIQKENGTLIVNSIGSIIVVE